MERARNGKQSSDDLQVILSTLQESMRAVQTAVNGQGLPQEQLDARLKDWQASIDELREELEVHQHPPAEAHRLASLYRISQAINSSLDLDTTLDAVMDALIQLTGAERGCLILRDEEGLLSTQVARNFDPSPELELSRSVIETVIESGEPIITTNAQSDPRFSEHTSVVDYQLRSIICVPLQVRNQVTGALYLDNRGREGAFSSDHVQLASRLADHAAIAIENARLYEAVHRANQAKTEFVSLVAHELRTPMTSIRGYADILAKEIAGPLTLQQSQFLNTIRSNVDRMQILVSDLQDISRIEAGRLKLETRPTYLEDALEEAVRTVQRSLERREQRLSQEVPVTLPPVEADPTRLSQVLVNLLGNAGKYSPEGREIDVRAWAEEGFVHCSVSDQGIGMSPEDQAQLFTKFFRSEDPQVQEQTGTGLGLCIVKNLVEMQGGEIEVESETGHGSTFTFTIPIAEETEKAPL